MIIKLSAAILAALVAILASLLVWIYLVHLAYGVDGYGPHGATFGIQPPHIAAGFGIVRDHVVTWWETQ